MAQLSAKSGEPTGPAVDRCPYSRSFTPQFADDPSCPAYQGASFTVTDTADRPLGPVLTCRHLSVGTDPGRTGRFYPRCGLGSAADRLRWVAAVTPARVAVMRSLEEEFDEATLAERRLLLEAKARLPRAAPDAAAIEALEIRLAAFLDRVDVFINERTERLADVGLRASQLKDLLAEWSMAWLRSHRLYGPGIETLHRAVATPGAAAFLGAELEGPAASAPDAAVVATAGPLVIERSEDPLVLHLRGEVDVTNSAAIATAVAGALDNADQVTVDFRGVLFCDLSGLRVLVRASEHARAGQTIVVSGLPEHLHRAMRMVGWSRLPGLVIRAPGDIHGTPANR